MNGFYLMVRRLWMTWTIWLRGLVRKKDGLREWEDKLGTQCTDIYRNTLRQSQNQTEINIKKKTSDHYNMKIDTKSPQ